MGNDTPLPFFVVELRPIGKKLCILKTADCNDRTGAENLSGKKIHVVEDDFEKYFEPDVASLIIGWKAIADGIELGTIDDVFILPQQRLAQVIYEGKEVLIPLNDETIEKADQNKKTLFLKLPDGLLDI